MIETRRLAGGDSACFGGGASSGIRPWPRVLRRT